MTAAGAVVYEEVKDERSSIPMSENVSYEKTTIKSSRRPMTVETIAASTLQEQEASLVDGSQAGHTCLSRIKSKTRYIAAVICVWELFLVLLVLVALSLTAWQTTGRSHREILETQQTVEELNNTVQQLNNTTQELRTTAQAQLEVVNDLNSTVFLLLDQLKALNSSSINLPPNSETTSAPTTAGDTPIPTEIATPTSSLVDQDVSITLNNVSLFTDCNTTIERTCTIQTDAAQCTTGFLHTFQRPGEFIMDISCVRQDAGSADRNGLSWVLSIDDTNNEVQCLCYVATLVTGASGSRQAETCGLRVTRCRTFSTITSTAALTISP